MTLSLGALRGALWNTVETVGSQATSFVLFLLFARLIRADELGLVQMALTLLAFLTIFVEDAFSSAIIRAPKLTPVALNTAFWLGTLGAFGLAAALTLAAPSIAALYDAPGLAQVLRVLAWTVPVSMLGSVQTALLHRELAFKRQALRRLIAVLVGGVVGVTLALRGAGLWSLVARFAVEACVDCVLAWVLVDFRPGARVSGEDARFFARFGSGVVGSYAVSYLNRRTEDLLIGFALGPLALGHYAVASRAILLVTEVALRAAQRTALPVFAKLQEEPQRARDAYYRATELAAGVACPIFIGMSAVAEETCLLLFGDAWAPVIPAMRILGFAGISMVVSIYVAPVLLGTGKPQWLFRYTAFETIVSVIAASLALPFGVEGVCLAYVARSFVMVPIALRMMALAIGVVPRAVLMRIWPPVLSAFTMFVVLSLTRSVIAPLPMVARLLALVLMGVASYVLCMLVVGRSLVLDVRRLFASYLRGQAA